ncbi:MAG: TIGR00730 family Rossman fold protein [Actinobacteria bacterium]|nr:TIGR00730 family Rossman fold protein [Actinomycetota bacterium]
MRICVFCGSSPGARPVYAEAARALGRLLVTRDIGVVYGGASVGTMGALADAVLAAGGDITGVIPRSLVEHEIAHAGLTKLEVVDTLHERKARMSELSDAFIALPGGLGTLEELTEVWSWGLLGLHTKPLGLLNVDGYYDPLAHLVDRMVAEGFLSPSGQAMLLLDEDGPGLLERLEGYSPPLGKWS